MYLYLLAAFKTFSLVLFFNNFIIIGLGMISLSLFGVKHFLIVYSITVVQFFSLLTPPPSSPLSPTFSPLFAVQVHGSSVHVLRLWYDLLRVYPT